MIAAAAPGPAQRAAQAAHPRRRRSPPAGRPERLAARPELLAGQLAQPGARLARPPVRRCARLRRLPPRASHRVALARCRRAAQPSNTSRHARAMRRGPPTSGGASRVTLATELGLATARSRFASLHRASGARTGHAGRSC